MCIRPTCDCSLVQYTPLGSYIPAEFIGTPREGFREHSVVYTALNLLLYTCSWDKSYSNAGLKGFEL